MSKNKIVHIDDLKARKLKKDMPKVNINFKPTESDYSDNQFERLSKALLNDKDALRFVKGEKQFEPKIGRIESVMSRFFTKNVFDETKTTEDFYSTIE